MAEQHLFNILVLCTGNSARSIMSEALINVMGAGKFKAYSAGSQPMGKVNPFATEQAARIGYDTSLLRSKSWDEFSHSDAPRMDLVITVCDSAAGESCPLWPGAPLKVHWGFTDPSHNAGSDDEKRLAFAHTCDLIAVKIKQLVALPIEQLMQPENKAALNTALEQIGSEA